MKDAVLQPRNTSTESKAELGANLANACPPGPGLPPDATGPSILTNEQHSTICNVFVLSSSSSNSSSSSSSSSSTIIKAAPITIPSINTEEQEEQKSDPSLKPKINPNAKENTLVALFTPYISQLCDLLPGTVLVNSELIQWIHTKLELPSLYQKPDLFMCHKSALIYSDAPKVNSKSVASTHFAQSYRHDSFIFGECVWSLRDCVYCIFEAKLQLSGNLHMELGEIFPKMQNLLRGTHIASSKCCLFDKHMVHLLEFTATGLLSRNQFSWTTPGSKDALLAFIRPKVEPTWVRVLNRLCEEFNVVLYFAPAPSTTDSIPNKKQSKLPSPCFLGRGATGRVFAVQRMGAPSSSPPFALKIADTPDHISMLEAELAKMDTIQKQLETTPNPSLQPYLPILQSERKVLPGRTGAGFLFGPVGKTVQTLPREQSLFNLVMDALFILHRNGISHGDPRMENLLKIDSGQLVWIDFRESGGREEEAIVWDLRKCLQSFFNFTEGAYEIELHEITISYYQLVNSPSPVVDYFTKFKERVWYALSIA